MSKELEALHRIANAKNHFKYDTLELVEKDFQIVQQGLLRLEAIDNSKASEALESLEKVNNYLNDVYDYKEIKEEVRKDIDTIKKALLELQSIKEAKPSEALGCVDDINADLVSLPKHIEGSDDTFDDYLEDISLKISIIKRVLLKYQEKEKDKVFLKSLHNTKVKVPLVDIFNGLPQAKRFAYTEHIYYHWEEMKESLEAEIKTIKGEKENLESKAKKQDKVLEIIKNKCLYTDNLNYVAVCINYDMYKEKMSKKHDTEVVKIDWNDRDLLDYLKLLKKEEFDLLRGIVVRKESE